MVTIAALDAAPLTQHRNEHRIPLSTRSSARKGYFHGKSRAR
jgi:hypothetical protein